MKKSAVVVCAVVFALAIWGSIAYAEALVVNIQFPFKAMGKDFPAGKYQIEAELQPGELKLTNEATGQGAVMTYTTRLSERDEALVVFDKQADKYFLSEIYIPGIDGFELKAAEGAHTHVKVKGSK